jgi:hypothetical protein
MSTFRKALLGAALAVTFAGPALAEGAEPWDLRDRMAYVVDPSGKMHTLPIGEHGMTMLMRHAKRVPKGTVLFMHDGQLYMMQGGQAFDRAGNWMGGT